MARLGVDFGTSTTVFAAGQGAVRFVADESGETVIPSVLAFTPTGRVRVGKPAKQRLFMDPANTIYSIKRILGRPWRDPDVVAFRKQYPFDLEASSDGTPIFKTRAGDFSPMQLVGMYLGEILAQKNFQALPAHGVAFALPERATAQHREVMLKAASDAGFTSATTISEPVAAALNYRGKFGPDATVLVYDLGGGTFDATLVRFDKDQMRAIASDGDSFLGGDDIDTAIAQWAATNILKQHHWDVRTSTVSYQRLRFLCEGAKIQMSAVDRAGINLSSVDEQLAGKTIVLERSQVEGLARPILDRSATVCRRVLQSVGVTAENLAGIVLVGGSTMAPYVQEYLTQYFDRPLFTDIAPDRAVAAGAAQFAGTPSP
jgi:molecular chaperone DnaK